MSHVRIEARPNGLRDLVFHRPPVNALSRALVEELHAAISQLARDRETRGVFLRSEGRVYCAGLDLQEVLSLKGQEAIEAHAAAVEALFLELYTVPWPVVTTIHGAAIAGGLVLAMCADRIVLSANDMQLGLTELQVGVPFPAAALEIVRATLPTSLLSRLVFDAELIKAEEAFVLGFGHQRVENATEAARAWLEKTAARPLEPYRLAKAGLREPVVRAAREQGPLLRRRFANSLDVPETRAAINAVFE